MLQQLSRSTVKRVHMVARRGPVQVPPSMQGPLPLRSRTWGPCTLAFGMAAVLAFAGGVRHQGAAGAMHAGWRARPYKEGRSGLGLGSGLRLGLGLGLVLGLGLG